MYTIFSCSLSYHMPCNSYPHLSLNYIDIFLPCKFFTCFSIFFPTFFVPYDCYPSLFTHRFLLPFNPNFLSDTFSPLYLLYLSSWFDIFFSSSRPICRLPSFFFLPCYFSTKILLNVSGHKHIRIRKYLYKVYMK